MSFQDCVDSMLRHRKIDRQYAAELVSEYNDLLRVYGDPDRARQQLMEALAAIGEESLRRAYNTEEVRLRGDERIFGHKNRHGEPDPAEAWQMMHLEAEKKAAIILAQAMEELNAFTHEYRKAWILGGALRRRLPWVRSKLDDIGRAMRGEKVADPQAKAMADKIAEVFEKGRVRAVEAGASIGKLENYMPQVWVPAALASYKDRHGINALVNRILPELDPASMVNAAGVPLTGARLREAVKYGLEQAMTDGMAHGDALDVPMGRGPLFKHRSHHRFFHFKDFDAWKRVMTDFGNADLYNLVTQHLGLMARDIAQMETFGPNPSVLRAYWANKLSQTAVRAPTLDGLLRSSKGDLTTLAAALSNNAGAALAPNIATLIDLTRQRILLEMSSLNGVRHQAAIAALNAEIATHEAAIDPAMWTQPASAHDMTIGVELRNILDTLRDPDWVAGIGNPSEYTNRAIRKADAMWEYMRGNMFAPSDMRMAAAFQNFRDLPTAMRLGRLGYEIVRMPFTPQALQGLRNWISASLMGSAFLSSVINDPVYGGMKRAALGMGREKSTTLRVFAGTLLNMVSSMSRAEAERALIAIESHNSTWVVNARMAGTYDPRGWTGWLADRVFSGTGFNAFTAAGKALFAKDFMGFVADQSPKPWDALHPWFRETLAFHGFDAGSWDKLRATPLYRRGRGATWLRPNEALAHAGREVGERYMMMLHREMDGAVPEGDAYTRTTILFDTKPGTIPGEAMRFAAQFKSFPMAAIMHTIVPIVRDLTGEEKVRGARLAGQLLITGTFLGMVTLALKDVKDGRDPRRWLTDEGWINPNMLGAAMLQAGGLGLYGDFLFSNLNRFGQSLPVSAAGPGVGWLDDVRNLTLGNLQRAVQGKETKVAADLIRFMRRNSPLASMWYLSLAYNRWVLDQLQIMWDKDARVAFHRVEAIRRRDYNGQEAYWPAGEMLPTRAPNFNVLRRR